jgi:hypothetical protein
MPFALGERVRRKGFVTQLISVINQSPGELERRLGYAAGRLAGGWTLLFLKEAVGGDEFRYGGYTHFSGGLVGPPAQGDGRDSVEDELGTLVGDVGALRRKRAEAIFQTTGPRRIVKLLPADGEDPNLDAAGNYPPGSGVPQFILTQEKWFVVGAVVGANRLHLGGGADGPLPQGFWINPARANTL